MRTATRADRCRTERVCGIAIGVRRPEQRTTARIDVDQDRRQLALPLATIFPQVSRSGTMRLKTSF